MTWPTYWIEDTGEGLAALRRYDASSHGQCSGPMGYHSTTLFLDERVAYPSQESGYKEHPASQYFEVPADDDPRWAMTCVCGYAYTDDDPKQPVVESIWRCPATGEEFVDRGDDTAGDLPEGYSLIRPGAVRHAPWIRHERLNPARPQDGLTPQVLCPRMDHPEVGGQWWSPDQAASRDGGFWTRTGDPRQPETFSVSPSIDIGPHGWPGRYHGFVQPGILTDHVG